jgi:hypothetical protein
VWLRWGCAHNTAKWNRWEQQLEKVGWGHTPDGAHPMALTVYADSPAEAHKAAMADLNDLRGLDLFGGCKLCGEVDFYLTIDTVRGE